MASVTTYETGQKTVTTSASELPTGDPNTVGGITIHALSSNATPVYIGNSGVTTTTGYALEAGNTITLPLENVDEVYVVCSTGSPVITWISM